jgi:hypothetical protein
MRAMVLSFLCETRDAVCLASAAAGITIHGMTQAFIPTLNVLNKTSWNRTVL